jgi:hypothetical protein
MLQRLAPQGLAPGTELIPRALLLPLISIHFILLVKRQKPIV